MKLFILFPLLVASVQALNILSILPYEGKSHFFVFKVLLNELVRKGHNVTVISHFPHPNPPDNYHDISLAGTIKILEDDMPPAERNYLDIINTGNFLFNTGVQDCEVMMANKQVQKLVEEKPKFDVVLVEQFNSDCGLGIAYKLQAPVVGITSHVLMPFHYQRFGIQSNPAYVSHHFLEGGTKPTLYQKIERAIFNFIFNSGYSLITQRSNQNTLAQYFNDLPALEDLAREIKFLLLYHNFILHGSKVLPANVIEVGGYHVAKAKPLTGDLKKFVDEAEHGVIYISFGSVVKSSSFPAAKVQVILNAMKEFPQRFIWKWEDKALLVGDNKKLYIDSWLPQVDILGHPKTLAFFSHAGMGGTTEAIHFGVPMIAMPILGDQPSNAAAIEESGFGVQLQYRDLAKDNLVAALKTVLDRFQEKAKQLSAAWHDRPLSPLDTAVFWIEFAARHSNFTFRTAAADVPTYQYFNLDVASVFILGFVCICGFVYVCLRIQRTIKGQPKLKRN